VNDDRGSGSVLVIAMIGAIVTVALAVLALGAGLAVRQRVVGAADAAALAAADAASGAVFVDSVGDPCALAARIAEANRTRLTACRIDGLVATVEVAAAFGALSTHARSTAGPHP
jgi:secretion/DNA translocation related TadE-like protein